MSKSIQWLIPKPKPTELHFLPVKDQLQQTGHTIKEEGMTLICCETKLTVHNWYGPTYAC